MMRNILPVLTVVTVIIVIWYAAAISMNAPWAYDQAARAGKELSFSELVKNTMSQERARLPAPHQVAAEIWKTTVQKKVTSKRSLIFHGWITLHATLWGFALGVTIGLTLAIAIVYSRVMEMGVMPWAVISQTIPIVAIAPMIIVMMSLMGIQERLVPKAIISAYLCFFPVLVGMIKGLRSPGMMQMDLLRTYHASPAQSFWKLRFPSSMPYLFTSLKIGIAAALVGTIVGELPTGALRGLGARILVGDQFGPPIRIWSALIVAALLAGALVTIVGIIQKITLKRMGMSR
ncbi:Pyrimidine ABC transporter, transmembrane component 1 [hydrothermal vent metagenome]|uniref:Pyrimidine ABC transporter, transmembrane component 1 n=1 Tax=hydrothermal vent metagenome TaxID=652676 RepID=A0A3B0R9L9_9ZZZZ